MQIITKEHTYILILGTGSLVDHNCESDSNMATGSEMSAEGSEAEGYIQAVSYKIIRYFNFK